MTGNVSLINNSKTRKIILITIIFSVLIIFLVSYLKTQKQENLKLDKYENAVNLIKQQKWNEAEQELEQLSGYKDSNVLVKYILAKKEISDYKELDNYEKSYNLILEVPKDYNGLFYDEMYKFKIELINDIEGVKKYQLGFEYLDKDDYSNALSCFKTSKDYKNSEMMKNLVWGFDEYTEWVKKGKPANSYEGNVAAIRFNELPKLNYKDFDERIEIAKKDLGEKYMQYAKNQETNKKKAAEFNSKYKLGDPSIGESKEEVLKYFDWSNPNHVNTTITAYGRSEQYVYSSNRYLYFENDKLTAIQK